jgi:hypothetical protein
MACGTRPFPSESQEVLVRWLTEAFDTYGQQLNTKLTVLKYTWLPAGCRIELVKRICRLGMKQVSSLLFLYLSHSALLAGRSRSVARWMPGPSLAVREYELLRCLLSAQEKRQRQPFVMAVQALRLAIH